jgi:hypothetical protein
MKEQLDLPARLVEVCDLLRRCIEIVADEAQNLACVGPDMDLTQVARERVAAIGGETACQPDDAVGNDRAAGLHAPLLDQRRPGISVGLV